MILGVGNDIIEISRIRKAFKRHKERFYKKLFTNKEISYCLAYVDPIPSMAGRFAAKESIAKALGVGFGVHLSWLDIEILNDESGRPLPYFSVKINTRFSSPKIDLSISHSKTFAIAVAIWSK